MYLLFHLAKQSLVAFASVPVPCGGPVSAATMTLIYKLSITAMILQEESPLHLESELIFLKGLSKLFLIRKAQLNVSHQCYSLITVQGFPNMEQGGGVGVGGLSCYQYKVLQITAWKWLQ